MRRAAAVDDEDAKARNRVVAREHERLATRECAQSSDERREVADGAIRVANIIGHGKQVVAACERGGGTRSRALQPVRSRAPLAQQIELPAEERKSIDR